MSQANKIYVAGHRGMVGSALVRRFVAGGYRVAMLARSADRLADLLALLRAGDADVEAWTPGAVGDREISDKNLRKRAREAEKAAEGARLAAASRDSGHATE